MKETHYSLRTSLVALLLCFVMLVGTTFAWFTDEVTSSNNIIKTGSLDIGFEWSADNATWIDVETDTTNSAIFNYDNWEPGYTEVRYLKVTNEGNLSFKYQLFINPTGTVGKLAEVIDVSWDIVTGNQNFVAPTADNKQGSLTKVDTLDELVGTSESVAGGVLLPANVFDTDYYSGEIVICVAFHMQETAGNDYQDKSIGDSFGINLYATQYDYENDSFGNDYDDKAEWPDRDTEVNTTFSIPNNKLINGYLTEEMIIYSEIPGVYAVLPEGVKFDKFEDLKFVIKANVDSPVTDDAGSSLLAKDVHIDGVAEDNTQPMIVHLGAILPKNLNDTELKLYHEDAPMTKVGSVDNFAINNQFTYDPATGEVAVYVDSFSVFSAVKTTVDVWEGASDTSWYVGHEADSEFTLNSAEQLAGFRDLVDKGVTFAGKTVNLGVDIDLTRIPFDPIGFGYWYEKNVVDGVDKNTVFMGTFDGQGHTIYNLYENCWELDPDKTNYGTYTYSTAGAGLFASIKGTEESPVVIKNLAISGAEIVFECVDMGIVVGYAQGVCHFENIVVTDSKIANYNRYTGGVVGEVSYGPYGKKIDENSEENKFSHTFKNITVDSSVTVSGLWGSFGCGMGGVIGGKWGDATVYMENVVSAPKMDVYNDVVSAYQWYAFRGCGMLIGHTEEPYSDGRTSGNATAGFLKCENVKVYYGDWVNYHYYEFENQDNTTGQRYPWVRAEAGEYCDAFSNIRYGVPTHNGVKVSDLTKKELEDIATDYTPITFDQLYGADRGMYGTATHPGVQVLYTNVKTIYFQNNGKWTDLKLHYWYVNGTDEWTTIVDGISMTGMLNGNDGTYDIYKIELPVYVAGIKITGSNKETGKILATDIVEGHIYSTHTVSNKINVYHCKYNSNTKTVKFDNRWEWKDIKIYYWFTDGTNNWGQVEWDDRQSMKLSTGTIYTFNLPEYAEGFVITGTYGTTTLQTKDQSVASLTNGKTYYPESCVLYEKQNDADRDTKTIFFRNDWKWGGVSLHAWITQSDGTQWPGYTMVKIGREKIDSKDNPNGISTYEYRDVYMCQIESKYNYMIFSNKGSDQTRDVYENVVDGAYFTVCYKNNRNEEFFIDRK